MSREIECECKDPLHYSTSPYPYGYPTLRSNVDNWGGLDRRARYVAALASLPDPRTFPSLPNPPSHPH